MKTVAMSSVVHTVVRLLKFARNIFIVVLTPIVLLPLILVVDGNEAKCAYVIIIMAVFWITEALPIAVTSLLPLILFPMVGLLYAKDVSSAYLNDTSTLFIGGLIVATAIEHWDIHKRLALRVLMLVGSEPRWLMFGMMLPTWFLSMWMSNTATTAMMIPIANAVLLQIKETREAEKRVDLTVCDQMDGDTELKVVVKNGKKDSSNLSTNVIDDPRKESKEQSDREKNEEADYSRMCKALSLGIAYSANCGGMATPTGTGPSVVMKGASDIAFEEKNATSPVSFATWMQYCLPISAILLILVWVFLQIIFLRCKTYNRKSPGQIAKVKEVIRRQYEELGPLTFGQGAVIVHFVLLALLWVTRKLGGVRGWGDLFPEKTVTDSTPAIFIAISLFLFPSVLPHKFKDKGKPLPPLLPWKAAEKNVPWGVVLLLGGGFAIAKGSKVSGLSKLIGEQLTVFEDFEPWVMNLVLCFMVAAATEVTSNIAICTLMMPIMKELSITLQVNPLYFMFPTAIATSFAFMLPVATPPNAVVFSYGFIRVLDMVVAGFPLNIIAVLVLVIGTETWGEAIFGFHTIPGAFKLGNDTTVLTNVTTVSVNSMSTEGPTF
ncbi:Na(+)/citrate cotransporter-like [Saccostrea echinata]|uniref:Na(+)/citrate cotransporter-like n=1 Tax=Saccostrea echinata TaxID=191078 RepID=UPI002A83EC50|nr:Na(+)/citrate cotransporter-like [Saccostrea echinata]